MKHLFQIITRHTLTSLLIAIFSVTTIATSIFAYNKISSLNSRVNDIPELKSAEEVLGEEVKSATPSASPKKPSGVIPSKAPLNPRDRKSVV